MPRRKFYSFYVRAAIDRDTMARGVDYEIPEIKAIYTFTSLSFLLYLSLAGFVCGFSLPNPSVAYAGEDEEIKTLSVAILPWVPEVLFFFHEERAVKTERRKINLWSRRL